MNNKKSVHCILCNGIAKLEKVIDKKIHKENIFGLNPKNYKRKIYQCLKCRHFFNIHRHEKFLNKVYSNSYSKYSYGNIKKKFQYIYNLPNRVSTNYSRYKYLSFFLKKRNIQKVLDIGSGSGIFPYTLKENGYEVEFVEKDLTSYKFLKNELKLKPYAKDLLKKRNMKKKFDLITCNKVLEHFTSKNLKKIILKIRKILVKKGIVYVEVPDAYCAKKHGFERQEFFFEHFHIFSKNSLKKLFLKNKFHIISIKQVVEKNNKFTLRLLAYKK